MQRPVANGFTLLELVIVLAIFGLVAAMAYGGLNNVLRAREDIERNHERAATLQRAYLRMREDFQQVQPRAIRDEFGDFRPAVIATQEDRVTFTRSGWQNPAGRSRSTMQRVSWAHENGRLVRHSYQVLDRAPDSQPVTVDVLPDVERVRFRYLDGQREWHQEWPPGVTQVPDLEAHTEPPLAIELRLETEKWGEIRLLFAGGSQLGLSGGGPAGGGGGGVQVGPGIGAGGGSRHPAGADPNPQVVP